MIEIQKNHPYFALKNIFSNDDLNLNLSIYVYRQDSLFDERTRIKLKASELTEEWINGAITNLDKSSELAIHSNVLIKNRTYHIPMIDFSYAGDITSKLDRINNYLPKNLKNKIIYFKSGRSYHAYSTFLLKPKEWIDFMGRLLLINQKKHDEIIDTRWIGHRLIGGYSSLRWSNNTNQYLDMPKKVNFNKSNFDKENIKYIDDNSIENKAIAKIQYNLL